MHTLLIHQPFVCPTDPGGTRHYELGRRLVESGNSFTIIAGDVAYFSGEAHPESQQFDGVRVLRAKTWGGLQKSYLQRIFSFLSFMINCIPVALRAKDVDVVMGTSPPIFQAFSAWMISVLKWRPFLLEIRDLWPEFAVDIGLLKNPVLIWVARRLERFLYRRATHILVNSPAYRDYLVDLGIPAGKISFIANGVDVSMFESNSSVNSNIRSEFKLDDKFVVTYAGALGMANDIDTVLQAAAHLSDVESVHFLIVGDGKERERLEAMQQELSLDNVTFAGPRPKSEMPAILESSDACVATLKNIPMFKTTYPNKVFDYMAAARPTILGIDGVIREVVEHADGGIAVTPGDSAELADAVLTIYRDPETGKRMGTSARDYVAEHFDRDQHARQLRDLLQDIKTKSAA
ncbi:MAG: glycosyltransferase family 4 protein [Planctomycetota bacterium]